MSLPREHKSLSVPSCSPPLVEFTVASFSRKTSTRAESASPVPPPPPPCGTPGTRGPSPVSAQKHPPRGPLAAAPQTPANPQYTTLFHLPAALGRGEPSLVPYFKSALMQRGPDPNAHEVLVHSRRRSSDDRGTRAQ